MRRLLQKGRKHDKKLLFIRALLFDAARVRENWFSFPVIMRASLAAASGAVKRFISEIQLGAE